MLKKKRIWIDKTSKPDTYAEFVGHFFAEEKSQVYINIAGEGHVALYVNEQLSFFGSSSDYPWYKLYYRVDITSYCNKENMLKILVWYPGENSQTYINDDAGLFFEIEQNGKTLLESGSHILSRSDVNYKNGYCKSMTSQLGFSFYYDNTILNETEYKPSVEINKEYEFHLRKTENLVLGERVTAACVSTKDGYLVDFGEEVVGFLEMEMSSSTEQEILIAYGEHLIDGHVSRHIGSRDFSVEFKAKEGNNTYLNPFRRLAGRYLQVFCKYPLEVSYIGIRPTDRKVVEIARSFKDEQLQKIYNVSVNTLKKCMHEHYEDCPWREQAMYTLDSRNQMLCGYYAFERDNYQKENIRFIAKGQREDGFLSLSFPTGIDIPIPFFSLVYLMQLNDYVVHSKDTEILKELESVVIKILNAFQNRIDDNGLIANLPYPYWNFYEWAEASNNECEITRSPNEAYIRQYDLILNCMYVYAVNLYEKLYGDKRNVDSTKVAIQKTFYDEKKAMYRLSTNGEHYSQLGNAFAILIGLGNLDLAEKMISDESLIRVTLSMNTFYYDALLQFGDTFQSFIIEDIRKKYGYMLQQGATTFWETEKGWEDFGGAGSLCHGWSAIPAYYLPILVEHKKHEK